MHFCDECFKGGVNMKNNNLDAFFDKYRFHMKTDKNHYKAKFIVIANRAMLLCQKTVKQNFQNGLN